MEFIPRVEPTYKKRRVEEGEVNATNEANPSPTCSSSHPLAAKDPQLAAMRGREEEGVSDETVTAMHMTYLALSDVVNREKAREKADPSTQSSASSSVGPQFEALDVTVRAFVARFAPVLQLGLCSPDAKEDPALALAKKVSPESAGYNQQAKPALGSLMAILVFLGTIVAEGRNGSDSHQQRAAFAMASFNAFLVSAFGSTDGEPSACAPSVLLGRFSYWLCNALESGALWLTVSRKSNNNKEKNATAAAPSTAAAATVVATPLDFEAGTAAATINAFVVSRHQQQQQGGVSQTPMCVQLQRLELLSWVLAMAIMAEGGSSSLQHHHFLLLHLRLMGRVCAVLLGATGADHHVHNARRNIAAWAHLGNMLKHLGLWCAGNAGDGGAATIAAVPCSSSSSPPIVYTSQSFIKYLESSILTAFARRDRGVAAMANLYRRRLEEALVAYNGATMESLRVSMGIALGSSGAPSSGNASFAGGSAASAPAVAAAAAAAAAPVAVNGVEAAATATAQSMQMLSYHQQGYHDCTRKIATAKPTAEELTEAYGVLSAAFGAAAFPALSPEEMSADVDVRLLLEVIAMFWLRPPCVAAA